METKLEMAHKWYMKYSESPSFMNTEVEMAWQYADAMQAEADKRNIKLEEDPSNFSGIMKAKVDAELYGNGFVKLKIVNNEFLYERLDPTLITINYIEVEEWQPDWSVAPEWANFIVMSKAGTSYWHANEPKASGNGWVGGGLCDLAYMDFYHNGDWRDSLRKRPQ